jgi:hypothetical protein
VLRDFTADMSQSVNNGEDWEGCLVHFNQKVEDQADVLVGGAGGFWHAHQQGGLPADSIEVEGYNITVDYNTGDVHNRDRRAELPVRSRDADSALRLRLRAGRPGERGRWHDRQGELRHPPESRAHGLR